MTRNLTPEQQRESLSAELKCATGVFEMANNVVDLLVGIISRFPSRETDRAGKGKEKVR